nr:unnamed protein product [Digitaria exilis]
MATGGRFARPLPTPAHSFGVPSESDATPPVPFPSQRRYGAMPVAAAASLSPASASPPNPTNGTRRRAAPQQARASVACHCRW